MTTGLERIDNRLKKLEARLGIRKDLCKKTYLRELQYLLEIFSLAQKMEKDPLSIPEAFGYPRRAFLRRWKAYQKKHYEEEPEEYEYEEEYPVISSEATERSEAEKYHENSRLPSVTRDDELKIHAEITVDPLNTSSISVEYDERYYNMTYMHEKPPIAAWPYFLPGFDPGRYYQYMYKDNDGRPVTTKYIPGARGP